MPELPEVEFTRRQINAWVAGQRLNEVALGTHTLAKDHDVLVAFGPLLGRRLDSVERCGKYLFLGFEGGWACSHLAMTGKWLPESQIGDRGRFVRFRLRFDELVLAFIDTRKFGRLDVLGTDHWRTWLSGKQIGLDVFDTDLTTRVLHERFEKTRRVIKSVLLDQKVLAGVGNIYACDALFLAGISPAERACDLSIAATEQLLEAIRSVMTLSLEREEGEEIHYLTEGNPENPFLVYGRKEQPCTRCGSQIIRIIQQARSTFYCRQCQPAMG
jgi:formamidopyrimidine-DNA glycosylase